MFAWEAALAACMECQATRFRREARFLASSTRRGNELLGLLPFSVRSSGRIVQQLDNLPRLSMRAGGIYVGQGKERKERGTD